MEDARKACKPDSVPGFPPSMTIHPGRALLHNSSCQPGPLGHGRTCGMIGRGQTSARGPYSALLPVGLAMPSLLPGTRWALAPPFHPYPVLPRTSPRQDKAVCFLWRFPAGFPVRALPGTVAMWSPDFPLGPAPQRPSGFPRVMYVYLDLLHVNNVIQKNTL